MSCFTRSFITASLLSLLAATLLLGGDIWKQKTGGDLPIPQLTNNKAYMGSDLPPISYWLMESGQISGIFSNNGLFGTGFISSPICDGEPCPSFETPPESDLEYLFGGMVWVAGVVGDDTLVSVGADGWYQVNELWPQQQQPAREFNGISDYSVWTHFTDTITDPDLTNTDPYDNRPHIPLNLRIANRAHIWQTDPENNLIIYDMVITNIGDELIREGYAGFYYDADVYHMSNQYSGFIDDITGTLRDEGIAYIIDNDGDPTEGQFDYRSPTKTFAFKFLSTSFDAYDTSYNWWISNSNPALDFGPQPVDEYGNIQCDYGTHTGTPTGDAFKYCIMRQGDWDYDLIRSPDTTITGWTHPSYQSAIDFADGYDTRFLMSIGPFDLAPDSSVRILFANFTGDDVHWVVDNLDNVYTDPDLYLANLDFTDLLANASIGDLITPLLINPNLPPTGLSIIGDSHDSVVVEWDPYGYTGVDGYEVYLYKIPQDSMPYPDAVPPWMELDDLSVMQLIANTGMSFRYTFDTLLQSHFYFASVANHTGSGAGDLCTPILVRSGGRIQGPVPEDRFLFIQEGELAAIRWMEPDGIDVDHYNIYMLAIDDTIPGIFNPFYDSGEFSDTAAPSDSFFREGQWYYYYSMTPYAQSDSGIVGFSDYPDDSSCYYITVVDKFGLESDFSEPVTVFVLDSFTPRDILVMNCVADDIRVDRVLCDSLVYFYDYALGDSYDRYYLADTIDAYSEFYTKPEMWRDLIPYSLVIIDGGIGVDIMTDDFFRRTVYDFEKYILSGGKLAYFGSFSGYRGEGLFDTPAFNSLDGWWFSSNYFGIDSIFHIGLFYYNYNSDPPYMDTLVGLTAAIPTRGEIPYISYNPLVNGLGMLSSVWPEEGTAPMPSAFALNQQGTPLYLAETLYPSTSVIEGRPIGVKTSVAGTATYLFGFHLWYMDPDEAAMLIDYIFEDDMSTEFICGDANGDQIADIGDAVFLINYIFRGGLPPEPEVAGDVTGDMTVNVGDVVYLVNYIFHDGPPPQCN